MYIIQIVTVKILKRETVDHMGRSHGEHLFTIYKLIETKDGGNMLRHAEKWIYQKHATQDSCKLAKYNTSKRI